MSENTLTLKRSSQMDLAGIESFLHNSKIPLRLASVGSDGVPLVSSLWYIYHEGAFYGAIHTSSLLASRLLSCADCGFEVAADTMPYCGVRGQGSVELVSSGASELLPRLFERYTIALDSYLAQWLLGRSDSEYVVKITPSWVTSWDYAERMAK